MNNDDWWFGQGDIGAVVFDKSIQLNDESVLLYVLELNDVKKYIASEICEDKKIKGVRFFTARSKDLLIKMNELALRGITIYSEKFNINSEIKEYS